MVVETDFRRDRAFGISPIDAISKNPLWIGESELHDYLKSYHLLVVDTGKRDVIPESIQLVAGRMGQEYKRGKNRRGGYWEDRYPAIGISP